VKEDFAAASRPSKFFGINFYSNKHAAGEKGLSPILLLFVVLLDDRRRRDIFITVVVIAAMLLLLRHVATSGLMTNSDRISRGHSRHGTVRCRYSVGWAVSPSSFVLSCRA
jgi:hypothetical protein